MRLEVSDKSEYYLKTGILASQNVLIDSFREGEIQMLK